MEASEVVAAIESNPEILTAVIPKVLESDKGKEIISNKAESIYKEKITSEVSEIHSQYDNDMFEILGEKPGQLEDGSKQKTYDKIKGLYKELKDLRGKKESLAKDQEVQRLQTEIEDLKKNGPGAHWEQTFNTEKTKWQKEKEQLTKELETTRNSVLDFRKRADIESGLRGLKWREDVPESARKALIDLQVNKMIKNSKLEGDKIIYLDDNGAQINDSEYKPESSKGILSSALKDIIQSKDSGGGGGAAKRVEGNIETISVEGKDVKRLQIPENSFKTKTEFLKAAEDALLKAGIARGAKEWDELKNEAYTRYNVKELPR